MLRKDTRSTVRVLIGFTLLLFLVVIHFGIAKIVSPLVSNDRPAQSELVVVLSAGDYENDLVDFETHVRLRKALELFQQSLAPKILCLSGAKEVGAEYSLAEKMRTELVAYGVPRERIFVHAEGTNTFEDIKGVARELSQKMDFGEVMFVTSHYHTLRVRLVLRRLNLNSRVVAATPYEFNAKTWRQKTDILYSALREYGAIIYFFLNDYI